MNSARRRSEGESSSSTRVMRAISEPESWGGAISISVSVQTEAQYFDGSDILQHGLDPLFDRISTMGTSALDEFDSLIQFMKKILQN